MKNDDLDILGTLKTPKPNESAREKAVFSAMEAFDAAAVEQTSQETQGNENGARPTTIINKLWSSFMDKTVKPIWTMNPATMATVVGALMLPVAGVVAWNAVQVGEVTPTESNVPANDAKVGNSSSKDSLAELVNPNEETAQTAEVKGKTSRDKVVPRHRELVAPKPVRRKTKQNIQVASTRSKIRRAKSRPVPDFEGGSSSSVVHSPVAPPRTKSSPPPISTGQENYTKFDDNPVKAVVSQPVSTFSIDVDSASYSRVRAALNQGNLPPKDMVRVEEMVNYFDYSYPLPETREQPFKPTVTIMPTPWNEHTKLMHIGIKGFDVPRETQPKANLVFLLDVSGSMRAPDKLPLLIKSFRLLLQKLNPTDTVSIVTYAGQAGTVLKPTKASDRTAIINALENLQAGGSTGGAQGIEQAYRLAEQSFVKDGVNRVMLATDGDFNVGISNPKQLKTFIAKKRKSGIFLSVFGFGKGNYNDALMQSLAQNGNGQAAYIDTLAEAQKTLVEEAGSTLFPIATDVKIQMEFNPAKIAEYRLIGYETRALKKEDFNNDKVDAGDIGAGHSVTAIYELTPVGSPAVLNDPLRYGEKPVAVSNPSDELGFLKMRYKLPGEQTSKLLTTSLSDALTADGGSSDAKFAVSVAAFGQKLRGNSAVSDLSYEKIADMANAEKGEDKFGYRAAFVQLVRMAGSLSK